MIRGLSRRADWQLKPDTLGVADLNLLEALFEPLTENPFFVKNKELEYVAANDAMVALCGLAYKKDLIGRTAWEIYSAHDAARYDVDERKVLSGKAIVDRLELIAVANRAPAWLLFSQLPIRDRLHQIVGIAGVSRRLDLKRSDKMTYVRIAAAIKYIRTSFAKPLSLTRLCQESGSSASQIERDFARLLHMSPRQYQQKVRIERALPMLAVGHPIAAVAHDCGFTDHSAFTRRFRHFLGISPSDFIKNHARSSR
jgi:AraC-like DNA-binding protein